MCFVEFEVVGVECYEVIGYLVGQCVGLRVQVVVGKDEGVGFVVE